MRSAWISPNTSRPVPSPPHDYAQAVGDGLEEPRLPPVEAIPPCARLGTAVKESGMIPPRSPERLRDSEATHVFMQAGHESADLPEDGRRPPPFYPARDPGHESADPRLGDTLRRRDGPKFPAARPYRRRDNKTALRP
jgi:hypothetical protein